MANISSAESLSRYIFSERYYSKSDNRVRFNAFMPRENEVKISVFRTSGLKEAEKWDIGKKLAKGRTSSLKGRADISCEWILGQNLSVESDEPPPLHANIVFQSKEKSEQKLIAVKLAGSSELYLV